MKLMFSRLTNGVNIRWICLGLLMLAMAAFGAAQGSGPFCSEAVCPTYSGGSAEAFRIDCEGFRNQLETCRVALEDWRVTLEMERKSLENKIAEANASLTEYQEAIASYRDKIQEYRNAFAEYSRLLTKYYDGIRTYKSHRDPTS